MLKFHHNRSMTLLFNTMLTLVCLCFYGVCHAELSSEDTRIINTINTNMASISNSSVTIMIKDGNITLQGVTVSDVMASNIISIVAATPGVRNINTNNLTLPNGTRIKRENIIIGLTRGYLLRNKLFGKSVTTVNEMPIRMMAEEGIIYIDGIVNNLYIMTTTLTTTMQVASRIDRNIRIISRMSIRKVTVRMP